MRFAHIALDVPLPGLFDYRLDGAVEADGLAQSAAGAAGGAVAGIIGHRVVVPFGHRSVVGVVLALCLAGSAVCVAGKSFMTGLSLPFG